MTPPADRIVAVVVTFNRRALLARLLTALDQQPHLDHIVIVDNASTDGTGTWLTEQLSNRPHTAPQWILKRLPQNLGGAGGFAAGLKAAMGLDANLFWLMDDDGLPAPDCLAQLLDHRHDFDFFGPVVTAENQPDRLCFPIRLPGTATVVHALTDVENAAQNGIIKDIVIPFNGVLLTRELVAKIGYPRAEFFIWGDDVEYLWRAQKAGARVGTVLAAHFAHPATDDLGHPMLAGRSTYNHSPSDLKHYCMARNNLVNLNQYRSPLHAGAFVAKTAWFYSVTQPSFSRLKLSAQAMWAGLRQDYTGHRQFLSQTPSPDQKVTQETTGAYAPAPKALPGDTPQPAFLDLSGVRVQHINAPTTAPTTSSQDSVAVVIVTFNRADLLAKMLAGLRAQTHQPDAVYVVDNCSTDHTAQVLAEYPDLPLVIATSPGNLGGAGGFHIGTRLAHAAGYDRLWLMDDDVVPAPECLAALMAQDQPCLMAVREDRSGALMEKSATRFDLTNPLYLRPKRGTVDSAYPQRAAMPALVRVEVVAFEGFMTHRRVIDQIGFPDASFFIFYDDADFVIRARRAGFGVFAVRDAVLIRQLAFDQQHDLASWKGRFMFRNLFAVHFRYGENIAVRSKPYLITAGVVAVNLLRRGAPAERKNVLRALREARQMYQVPTAENTPPSAANSS